MGARSGLSHRPQPWVVIASTDREVSAITTADRACVWGEGAGVAAERRELISQSTFTSYRILFLVVFSLSFLHCSFASLKSLIIPVVFPRSSIFFSRLLTRNKVISLVRTAAGVRTGLWKSDEWVTDDSRFGVG